MFNPIMTAALRMSSVNLSKRIRNEGEIFYEHIKTMNLTFYSNFLPGPFKIYQMYVIFKDAKKLKQNKFKIY